MLPSATTQLPPALGKTKGHPPRACPLGQPCVLHGGKPFLQWYNFAKRRAELTQSRGSAALKSSWTIYPQLQLLVPTQRCLSIILSSPVTVLAAMLQEDGFHSEMMVWFGFLIQDTEKGSKVKCSHQPPLHGLPIVIICIVLIFHSCKRRSYKMGASPPTSLSQPCVTNTIWYIYIIIIYI